MGNRFIFETPNPELKTGSIESDKEKKQKEKVETTEQQKKFPGVPVNVDAPEKTKEIEEFKEKPKPPELELKEREKDAKTGSQFREELNRRAEYIRKHGKTPEGVPVKPNEIKKAIAEDRDKAIINEVLEKGNIPKEKRKMVEVPIRFKTPDGQIIEGSVYTFDLVIGDEKDHQRFPLGGPAIHYLTQRLGCVLPTAQITDILAQKGKHVPFVAAPEVAARMNIPWDNNRPDGNWMRDNDFSRVHNEILNEKIQKAKLFPGKINIPVNYGKTVVYRDASNLGIHGGHTTPNHFSVESKKDKNKKYPSDASQDEFEFQAQKMVINGNEVNYSPIQPGSVSNHEPGYYDHSHIEYHPLAGKSVFKVNDKYYRVNTRDVYAGKIFPGVPESKNWYKLLNASGPIDITQQYKPTPWLLTSFGELAPPPKSEKQVTLQNSDPEPKEQPITLAPPPQPPTSETTRKPPTPTPSPGSSDRASSPSPSVPSSAPAKASSPHGEITSAPSPRGVIGYAPSPRTASEPKNPPRSTETQPSTGSPRTEAPSRPSVTPSIVPNEHREVLTGTITGRIVFGGDSILNSLFKQVKGKPGDKNAHKIKTHRLSQNSDLKIEGAPYQMTQGAETSKWLLMQIRNAEKDGSLKGYENYVGLIGTNDIGNYQSADFSPESIIQRIEEIAKIAHRNGIKVYLCTIPPFKGGGTSIYNTQFAKINASREKINNYIRTNQTIPHEVIDLDKLLQDPNQPDTMDRNFWAWKKDPLHPDPKKLSSILQQEILRKQQGGNPKKVTSGEVPASPVTTGPEMPAPKTPPNEARPHAEPVLRSVPESTEKIPAQKLENVPFGKQSKAHIDIPEINPQKPTHLLLYFPGNGCPLSKAKEDLESQIKAIRANGEQVIIAIVEDPFLMAKESSLRWQEFNDPKVFPELISKIQTATNGVDFETISFAAHSGGYKGIHKLLSNHDTEKDPMADKFNKVILLEAAYGDPSILTRYVQKPGRKIFATSSRKNEPSLTKGIEKLAEQNKRNPRVHIQPSKSKNHVIAHQELADFYAKD